MAIITFYKNTFVLALTNNLDGYFEYAQNIQDETLIIHTLILE